MPGAEHFLPVWVLHVIKKVYHTAINAPNFPRHRLRYGPKEIRGFRDETDKFETLLKGAIQIHFIAFHDLEKLAGKCTSMSFAVPPVSLYTYHMYKKIRKIPKSEILFN